MTCTQENLVFITNILWHILEANIGKHWSFSLNAMEELHFNSKDVLDFNWNKDINTLSKCFYFCMWCYLLKIEEPLLWHIIIDCHQIFCSSCCHWSCDMFSTQCALLTKSIFVCRDPNGNHHVEKFNYNYHVEVKKPSCGKVNTNHHVKLWAITISCRGLKISNDHLCGVVTIIIMWNYEVWTIMVHCELKPLLEV